MTLPDLRQFRVERHHDDLVHLVFDAPARTMNVFSNAAILELRAFAKWLGESDVRGVVLRSGKPNAFCAGADLNELVTAYDMVMAAPARNRFAIAFDHFFALSAAIRALETSGKPIAAAVAGVALGGGCELALGAHYRVLTDDPNASMGLPESLVGLLPGAGGTQRLPRLIGLDAALPILLGGNRLSGERAVKTGLAHELVAPGQEIGAAERWLLEVGACEQPWDRSDWQTSIGAEVAAKTSKVRADVLDETLGHYPAPLAILDCLELGLPQIFDGAIRTEMAIFAQLIQRPEPRNMIGTLFLGKTDYDRRMRRHEMPSFVADTVDAVRSVLSASASHGAALAEAGFAVASDLAAKPARERTRPGFWVDELMPNVSQRAARAVLEAIGRSVEAIAATLSDNDRRLADYAAVREAGYPAYLGGPFTFPVRTLRSGTDNSSGPSR